MKAIARRPAWVGVLAFVVLTIVGCAVYLTIAKAVDLAIVTAWGA